MRLRGRIAIVTGAGRGIGRAIAERYAAEGADLALVDVDATHLDELATAVRALGRRASIHRADLADAAQAQAVVREAVAALGRVDVLVNNAGRAGPRPMLELTPADWDAMFD